MLDLKFWWFLNKRTVKEELAGWALATAVLCGSLAFLSIVMS
jgi:hypothetical protein